MRTSSETITAIAEGGGDATVCGADFVVAARGYEPRTAELRFDMYDAEFTHEGEQCTFEVLLRRFGIEDGALQAIAEMIHDIDLEDDAHWSSRDVQPRGHRRRHRVGGSRLHAANRARLRGVRGPVCLLPAEDKVTPC